MFLDVIKVYPTLKRFYGQYDWIEFVLMKWVDGIKEFSSGIYMLFA